MSLNNFDTESFSVKTLTSRSCLLEDKDGNRWVLMNVNKFKAEDAAVRFAMAVALGDNVSMVEFFENEGVTIS